MKKLLLSSVALVLVCTSVAVSQNAARGPRQGGPAARGPAPEQIPPAIDWGRDKMPNLVALAETRRPRFTAALVNHFRTYTNANPLLRERLNKTFAEEDRIYGMLIELEKAPPEERPALRQKIAVATREALQANLDERASRIAKLKQDLADQEMQLKADQRDMELIITRQLINRFGIDASALGPTTAPTTRNSTEASSAPRDVLAAPQQ